MLRHPPPLVLALLLAGGCHALLPFGPGGDRAQGAGDGGKPARDGRAVDQSRGDLGPRVTVSGTVGEGLVLLMATRCTPQNPALDCKGTLFVGVYKDDILFPDPARLLGSWSKDNVDLSSKSTLVPFSIEIPAVPGDVTFHTFLSEEPAKHPTLHSCDPWCLTGVPRPLEGKGLTGVALTLEGRWDEPWFINCGSGQ